MAIIGTPIGDIADLGNAAARIIGLFKADPNVKAAGQIQLDEAALQGQIQEVLAQIQVNATEASSQSIFVAGWRPAVGWVCAAGFAYSEVLRDLINTVATLFHHALNLPPLDTTLLITTLAGILGLGTLRTVEKVQGAAGNAAH